MLFGNAPDLARDAKRGLGLQENGLAGTGEASRRAANSKGTRANSEAERIKRVRRAPALAAAIR